MSLLFFLSIILFQGEDKTVFLDRVAIKVNDKMMTERELIQAYRDRRRSALERYTGAELDKALKSAWQDTVKEAEETLLLYEKAVELGIAFSLEDARSRLMALKDSNGMSDQEFEEAILEQTGMTLLEFVDFRQRADSAEAAVQHQVFSKIKIEDSEIAKYYDEHQQEFMNPETYRIAEIVFLKEDQNTTALKFKAQACLDFLNEGGDFAEAAALYSDSTSKENGGDLGDVKFGDLNKTIEDQVKNLELNQASELLETQFAFFIIKLINRTPSTPKPLDEVRPAIINSLRAPRMETRIKTFMEELRSQYLLQVYTKEKPWYLDI